MDSISKAVLALVFIFAGIFLLVVVVGLFQGRLDPQGTATVIGGIITGLMAGFFYRQKGDGGGGQ